MARDGGSWQNSGATVSGLEVGTYFVEYKTIAGWTAPPGEDVEVYDGQTTAISRDYSLQTGSLRVNLGPPDAVADGAQWRVDGGSWQNSGATVSGLEVGTYFVEYKTIAGWTAPPGEDVEVYDGQTTAISRDYSLQTGSLRVNLGPPDAVADGAQWRVDGGSWQNSGATVSGLEVGTYFVEYKDDCGLDGAAGRRRRSIRRPDDGNCA